MSDAKAESVARVLEGIAAPAVEPITAIWTDAKLRGIASDYFPDAKDWPAAMLCLRHLLMEQASAKPVVEPVQSADIERIRHVANEWADMAANLLQGLRNISDGISNVDEVLALAEENLAHCQEVNDAAFSGAIGASARELATSAQQLSLIHI